MLPTYMTTAAALCRFVFCQCNRRAARIGVALRRQYQRRRRWTTHENSLLSHQTLGPASGLLSLFRYRRTLLLSAQPRKGCKSLSSPRGHGNSCNGFHNKIVDRFFEDAIATASVGRLYTVADFVVSFLCFCACQAGKTDDNAIYGVDKYRVLTIAPWILPLAVRAPSR